MSTMVEPSARDQIESVRRTLHEAVVGMKRLDTYAVAGQVVALCDVMLQFAGAVAYSISAKQPPTQEIQRMKIDAEIGQQVRHNHTGITGRVVGVFRDRNNVDWLYVESVDANRLSFERCVPASECSTDGGGAGPTETKEL